MASPAPHLPSTSTPREDTRYQPVTLRLPAVAASVARARAGVYRVLRERHLSDQVCDDAVLIISELVTNAIAHAAGSQVVCRLHADRAALRIEVEDQGGGAATPHPRTPVADDEHGRGLILVGALSTAWGVRQNPGALGRTVWAELPPTPTAPPAAEPTRHAPPLPCLLPPPPGRPTMERSTVPDCDRR